CVGRRWHRISYRGRPGALHRQQHLWLIHRNPSRSAGAYSLRCSRRDVRRQHWGCPQSHAVRSRCGAARRRMSRRQLFLRLLVRAAWVRKDRAFTALLSVAVVATIATAALTVYSDLDNKLSREFRSFGANVVVGKQDGALTRDELARIDSTLSVKH